MDLLEVSSLICKKVDEKIFFTQNNYFKDTFGVFEKRSLSEVKLMKPDFISYMKGYYDKSMKSFFEFEGDGEAPVSSKYFYTAEGVYRLSDHWGQCGNCFWILCENNSINNIAKNVFDFESWTEYEDMELGFCNWNNFFPIIEKQTEDLSEEFYLAVEFRDVMLTQKVDDLTPIHWHKNHKNPNVFMVDNLRFLKNNQNQDATITHGIFSL